jgi:hypothetical protein
MKPKVIIVVAAIVLLCVAAVAAAAFLMTSNAKRKAPPSIAPVVIGTNEFRVPNTIQTEGIVEAWNAGGSTLLWQKKIYSTLKLPGILMETDVRLNFITNMTVGPGPEELSIANEKGQHYILNTSSRKVHRK